MNDVQSNDAKVNKTAMGLFTALTLTIALAYVIQLVKGEAGIGKFLSV